MTEIKKDSSNQPAHQNIAANLEFAGEHAKKKFGIDFLEMADGKARASLLIEEKHLNAFQIPYGTFLFNLADMTCGVAYLTVGGFGPTVNSTMNFISAAKCGDTVICSAEVIKHGKKLSFVTSEIRTETNRLIARADFTFYTL